MNFPNALRVAATLLLATGPSVAGAQLSSRSANGGLFNTLVDWNPAADYVLYGAGDVRMSPWAAHRVQLGTVRAADPNRTWMGYYGHRQDREMEDLIGAEHSLQAAPIAYIASRKQAERLFGGDVPRGGTDTPGAAVPSTVETGGDTPIFQPVTPGPQGPLAANLGPVSAADVIINPEPEAYWLAAGGLLLIAIIRKYRLA